MCNFLTKRLLTALNFDFVRTHSNDKTSMRFVCLIPPGLLAEATPKHSVRLKKHNWEHFKQATYSLLPHCAGPAMRAFCHLYNMKTPSNGTIVRVTGPLCGEFTGPGDFPSQRPETRSFNIFFDLRLNILLSKQSWCRSSKTPSRSLWRHCNEHNSRTASKDMLFLLHVFHGGRLNTYAITCNWLLLVV